MTSRAAWEAVADFWPRAATSQFVRAAELDFHVQVSGSGDDVLMLHGAGASSHSFAELAERRGEISAEVTSAQSLSEDQARAVEEALQRVEGRNVALSMKVDPALIGGMVVQVGSRMIDSSIKTQLDRMKLVMKGAG